MLCNLLQTQRQLLNGRPQESARLHRHHNHRPRIVIMLIKVIPFLPPSMEWNCSLENNKILSLTFWLSDLSARCHDATTLPEMEGDYRRNLNKK